jgi:hypothetical protein
MYRDHMPPIRDAMRNDFTVFQRGVLFVVCSIRQPIIRVPDQLTALYSIGTEENPLFGCKRDAYAFIVAEEFARPLWETMRDLFDPELAILAISRVPGLGIVKSAFVAQLMGIDVACLDSRNITRDGRNPRAYRTDGEARKTIPAYRRKVARYVADVGGKAEAYWNAWCSDVAPRYKRSADEISALHLAIIPDNFIPF